MIDINLLPGSSKDSKTSGMAFVDQMGLSKEIILGVGSLVLFILISVHLFFMGAWIIAETKHVLNQMTWQKMLPQKNNIDAIHQELKELKVKMTTINDIAVKKSVFWSQKLNSLSSKLPQEIWMSELTFSNNSLIIKASAVSKERDEVSIAGDFVAELKKDDGFSKDFTSIELGAVSISKKGPTQVAEFTVTAKLK